MFLTLFTPTYNRAHLLTRLYDSLLAQTHFDFEWVIVDDGSTDNTSYLIQQFQKNTSAFPIIYEKQTNSGKHIAINKGANIASGELFFIVDSDDHLTSDCIQFVSSEWEKIRRDEAFAGLAPNKCFKNGVPTGKPNYRILDCSPPDFRFKYLEKGDKAEVIRTSLFLKYPFPETTGEKFCPEALFFNRLSKYKLRYFDKNLYVCEYLPGGLSAKITKIREESPINSCLCYQEMANLDVPMKSKLKALLNFYRFKRFTTKNISEPKVNVVLRGVAKVIINCYYIFYRKF